MMLHEITHNLGAVQPSAPHSTPNGHCWDGNDVMCYADGSTGSQPYTTSVCPSIPGTITDVYDCGHDDYYDPAAAPGSYLDTHWNVYRSVFMSPCTSLGDACGGLARTLTPPVSSAPPEVQGTAAGGRGPRRHRRLLAERADLLPGAVAAGARPAAPGTTCSTATSSRSACPTSAPACGRW